MTDKWEVALEALGLSDQDFGPVYTGTYSELFSGWRGTEDCPTEIALTDAYDTYILGTTLNAVVAAIKETMSTILTETGFTWKFNGGDAPNQLWLDPQMIQFFQVQNALLERGVVDPHNGKVWQGDTEFTINDIGMNELCEFAGAWGSEISGVSHDEKVIVMAYVNDNGNTTSEKMIYLDAYDETIIDWSVTWSASRQSNGWSNNTLTQLP